MRKNNTNYETNKTLRNKNQIKKGTKRGTELNETNKIERIKNRI